MNSPAYIYDSAINIIYIYIFISTLKGSLCLKRQHERKKFKREIYPKILKEDKHINIFNFLKIIYYVNNICFLLYLSYRASDLWLKGRILNAPTTANLYMFIH